MSIDNDKGIFQIEIINQNESEKNILGIDNRENIIFYSEKLGILLHKFVLKDFYKTNKFILGFEGYKYLSADENNLDNYPFKISITDELDEALTFEYINNYLITEIDGDNYYIYRSPEINDYKVYLNKEKSTKLSFVYKNYDNEFFGNEIIFIDDLDEETDPLIIKIKGIKNISKKDRMRFTNIIFKRKIASYEYILNSFL